ncbi:MAG: hypothetical protein BA870_11070 [Desulfuromonadales bacterium C00003094]|jgi:hypothetical protein|nr:MAG: hypothetical protein BA870_11070 [Desulfuromonadales bacterium C00003094]OEU75580.1 MAG: hypothetical protein BA869_12290 [Desulfuromonadales bacterium C00003107]
MTARRCFSFFGLGLLFFIKSLSEAPCAGIARGPSPIFVIFSLHFLEISEEKQGKRIIRRDELLVSAQEFPGSDLLLKFTCRGAIFKGRERGLAFAAYMNVIWGKFA